MPPGPRGSNIQLAGELGELPLIVQGERDSFGIPSPSASRTVAQVPGDHSLKKDVAAVGDAVRTWLGGLVGL